ncbi:MAG: WecB/TagA/CpsF family glycosyltransferase [Streptosporangiaceae bacterium]
MGARVRVGGPAFDLLTHAELLDRVAEAIGHGSGGTIVTPNIDICRQVRRDRASRALVADATLVVPDGMPLIWASRLAGRPLPERITGADLIFSLSQRAAAEAWPIFVLGGLPGSGGEPSTARRAADSLAIRYRGLSVVGSWSPPLNFDPVAADIGDLLRELVRGDPVLVFVGLGFPKQERLIARLAPHLPRTWFVGCGAAVPLAAGMVRRAPGWLQRAGLEWAFRLASEPGRLARRYLVHDLPFALRLLTVSAFRRLSGPAPLLTAEAARQVPMIPADQVPEPAADQVPEPAAETSAANSELREAI